MIESEGQETAVVARVWNAEHLQPSESPGPTRRPEPALRVSLLPGRMGLVVAGEVDLATHRKWDSALESLLVNGIPGRLDLSGLSFIDGRGTAALVVVARRMAPDRILTLYRPPLCLRRILELFWPGELLEIKAEDEEAG